MKHIYTVVFSVIFVILTGFICKYCIGLKAYDAMENIIFFEIDCGQTELIKPWKNNEDKYFVFLPSYAELENVVLKLKGNKSIFLDDLEFFDGDSIEGVELSKEYMLGFKKSDKKYPIQFLRSANVATMYVNTQTGSMDRVYADKNNKEKASVSLYTSNGIVDYFDDRYGDVIKCRGNSTFAAYKKAFLLNLDKPSDLLGMGSAEKWVLLANAFDLTNLKNKLVLDFGKKTCLKWTPGCEYVDLYLNGEYNGLYLLCEKVEVGENRLNIDTNSGFLVESDSEVTDRGMSVTTNGNRAFKIIYPKSITDKNLDDVKCKMQKIENSIVKKSLKGSIQHIDVNSWATRYLIDEVFYNVDGDSRSCYYYWDSSNKNVYAGPIWDYDLSFGEQKGFNPVNSIYGEQRKWYSYLIKNTVFMNAVKKIYIEEFKDNVSHLVVSGIDIEKTQISGATELNNYRWNIDYKTYNNECRYLKDFFCGRIEFLEKFWFDGYKYHNVDIDICGKNVVYKIVDGEKIAKPLNKDIFIEGNVTWIDKTTREEFDFNQPILENKEIYAQVDINSKEYIYARLVQYLEITILAAFFIVLAVLAFVSFKNRQRG